MSILVESEKGLARVTLNRPDRRNALTAEGWAVIHATADGVRNRPEEFLAEVHRTRASQARLRGGTAGPSA